MTHNNDMYFLIYYGDKMRNHEGNENQGRQWSND